jgi:hypothetical protein
MCRVVYKFHYLVVDVHEAPNNGLHKLKLWGDSNKHTLLLLCLYFDGIRCCEVLDIRSGIDETSKCGLKVMPDSLSL